MRLREFFSLVEVTPFAQQATATSQTNAMGQARIDPNSSGTAGLQQVEALLRKVLVAETGGPVLAKIINKFLVDITPYMESQ